MMPLVSLTVSTPVNCENELYVPVCDTDGIQHPNLCKLQKRRKVLAYRGECMVSTAYRIVSIVKGRHIPLSLTPSYPTPLLPPSLLFLVVIRKG